MTGDTAGAAMIEKASSHRAGEDDAAGATAGETGAGETGTSRAPPRTLSPAAQRALQEAAERRAHREAEARAAGKDAELGGRGGPDPVRYGDWENGGIASDF